MTEADREQLRRAMQPVEERERLRLRDIESLKIMGLATYAEMKEAFEIKRRQFYRGHGSRGAGDDKGKARRVGAQR